jgi:phenylacetate-CoA ligase
MLYPWLTFNVFFRLQEALKRHPTYAILADMESAERLSALEFDALQSRKLQDFIRYCHEHVPFVRDRMNEAGLSPADIQCPEDLARLPIMRKADMRVNRETLRSDCAGEMANFSTGGSTGEPLIFDLAKRRIGARVACRQRVTRWWGLSVGVPELAIWGSPLELSHQDWFRTMRDRVMRSRLLSAYEMNEDTASAYLDIIESGRWRQIFAYPSSMYTLCLYARKQNRDLRNAAIRVVFVTSEVLYPHQRDLIAETFACPVANGYGGRDSGFIAHECPQGGMHLMADAVVAEIVDEAGRPLPPGETGEIVITDLYSHESPFLRYATGDRGALSDRKCPCGRALPLLERLDGRANDSIVAPDGRVMHGQSLIGLLMEIPGIEQFRIHQTAAASFDVYMVCNERFPADAETRIRSTWSNRLRASLDIRFHRVTTMPREASGKHRHIVSDVRPAAEAGVVMANQLL